MTETFIQRLSLAPMKRHIPLAAPYIVTLYYFEIIFVMPVLYFIVGKAVAVIMGLVLAVLLTIHIVMLYFRLDLNRRIQLIITDIHFAYVLAVLVNYALLDFEGNAIDIVIYVVRTITLLADIPLWLGLTDSQVRAVYASDNSVKKS